MPTLTPSRITELGRRLYAERFRQQLEAEHTGEFVAIDVSTETPYLGQTAFQALRTGETAHPEGFFYLLRIGEPGVYRLNSGRSSSRAGFFR